jgi:hypothetical protein
MPRRTRAVHVTGNLSVVLMLFAVAACSSSQTSKAGAALPAQSSGKLASSGNSGRPVPLRIFYHEKSAYADSDPREWTKDGAQRREPQISHDVESARL